MALVARYRERIERHFGVMRFEIALPPKGSAGGQPMTYALLTEQQSTFIITLTRNTEPVLDFKTALVKAFYAKRSAMSIEAPDYEAPEAPEFLNPVDGWLSVRDFQQRQEAGIPFRQLARYSTRVRMLSCAHGYIPEHRELEDGGQVRIFPAWMHEEAWAEMVPSVPLLGDGSGWTPRGEELRGWIEPVLEKIEDTGDPADILDIDDELERRVQVQSGKKLYRSIIIGILLRLCPAWRARRSVYRRKDNQRKTIGYTGLRWKPEETPTPVVPS